VELHIACLTLFAAVDLYLLPHCSIPPLFHPFALSWQVSYRLRFAIDRLIDIIHPKLFRLTLRLLREQQPQLLAAIRAIVIRNRGPV
jgi:hypothetical protein